MSTPYESISKEKMAEERKGLASVIFRNAAERPDFVQLSRKVHGEWVDVTSSEFAEDVLAVAKGLIASGLNHEDRLGLMAGNSYEWTLFDYAAWSIGVISVPIYHTAAPEQVAMALTESGSIGCVVGTEAHTMTVGSILHRLPHLKHIWEIDAGAVDTLKQAGQHLDDSVVHWRAARVTPHSVATIAYTAGTTGRIKGCIITHGNLQAQAKAILGHAYDVIYNVPKKTSPATLLFLPLSHVFGRTVQVGAFEGGVHLAHSEAMNATGLMSDLASFRPTFLLAVPHIFERVFAAARHAAQARGKGALFDRAVRVASEYAEQEEGRIFSGALRPSLSLQIRRAFYDRLVYSKIRRILGGRMRNAVSGGSALSRPLGLFFYGAGITLYEGYGLTESSAGITCNPPGRVKFGTVGHPVEGVQIRIAGDGEIMLRGEQMFTRYLNDPHASEQALKDGWLATGDLGAMDGDGYLSIVGRKKNVIITSGGKTISPESIEQMVCEHPFVAQCVMVGNGLPYVTALITLDQDTMRHWFGEGTGAAKITQDGDHREAIRMEIWRAVNRANSVVSRAESIRDFRVLDEVFTQESGLLTPTLKVRRAEVTVRHAPLIEMMYAGRRGRIDVARESLK
ncbi:AMP-dependent synthetase/ligase [Streptomyces sp. NPDC087901]|uniref:AMP-dependent synthetase/ligase n=1 Tax=Streptomyces sp. NPDC087901 TaxID=3365818 RepID=UPI0038234630